MAVGIDGWEIDEWDVWRRHASHEFRFAIWLSFYLGVLINKS